MKRKLFGIRVNYHVGSYLREKRLQARKGSVEAASHINIPTAVMLSYEMGAKGIPLKFFAKLMRFYGADEFESAWKINSIPHEMKTECAIASLTKAAAHRLQVLSDFYPRKTTLRANPQHWLF